MMKNRSLRDRVLEYNRELKEALMLILGELNQGQRQKLLKNERVKALIERYGINS